MASKVYSGVSGRLGGDPVSVPKKETAAEYAKRIAISNEVNAKKSDVLGAKQKYEQRLADSNAVNDAKAKVSASMLKAQGKNTDGTPILKPGGTQLGGGSGAGGRSTTSGGSSGGANPYGMMDPTKAALMGGQELADKFGFIYGEDNIRQRLNDASNAKFNEWEGQTRKNRDQSLTDYSDQFQQYRLENRNKQQGAMKNGLSRGAGIAQEVMGQLGAQQQGAQQQQTYQQNLADIALQRGTQLASDGFTAMTQQNALAGQMGTMAVNQQGNTVQENAAYQSYGGQMAQAAAQQAAAGATRYAANRNYAASSNQTTAQQTANNGLAAAAEASGLPKQWATQIAYGLDPEWVWQKYYDEQAKINKTNRPRGANVTPGGGSSGRTSDGSIM
jgi:hypothetical protein